MKRHNPILEDQLRRTLDRRAAGAGVSDDAWARISARTGRRPRLMLALAAVAPVVLVAVVTTAALTGTDDGIDDPTVVAGPGPTPGPDYSQPSDALLLGSGEVQAISADGSAVIVSDLDDRYAEPGCEGMPEQVLVRIPVTGEGREVILGPSGAPLQAGLVRGPADRVALIEDCEGFLGGISVGTMSESGTITDVADVPADVESESHVEGWDTAGNHLFLTSVVVQENRGEDTDRRAIQLDVASGEQKEMFRGPDFGQWDALAEGRLVFGSTSSGRVEIKRPDGTVERSAPGDRFTAAPDRRRVAAFGRALTILSADGTQTLLEMPGDDRITDVAWSRAGDALAYVTERTNPDTNASTSDVFVLPLGGQPTAVAGPADSYGGLSFSDTGAMLVFSTIDFAEYETRTFAVTFPRPR